MKRIRKRPCIIWGATGQAKVVYDILLSESSTIMHLFDTNPNVKSPFAHIPISFGSDGLISFINEIRNKQLKLEDIDCIAAIGGAHGYEREKMTGFMESYGFNPRSLIHKSAVISPLADIGSSVQILAGSVVGAFASIGDFSIINSGANVDHDCVIGKNCHLGPRATLAGEVHIENNVFIGTNATILPRIRIGSGAQIGAGAVVTKNVPPGVIFVGNPGRPLEK